MSLSFFPFFDAKFDRFSSELHVSFVVFSFAIVFSLFFLLDGLANFLSTSQWTLMMLLFLQGPGLSVEMKQCTITLIVIFKRSRRLSVLLQVGKIFLTIMGI